VLLGGTVPEVEDQVARLGGDAVADLVYPEPPRGDVVWSVRVRPRLMPDMVKMFPDGPHVIQPGIGEATFAATAGWDVAPLRSLAETGGGAVVRVGGWSEADPWGSPPPALELQRRVVAAFDPMRVVEPGRLPGGV
jgi:hypothetical protein